MKHDNRGPSYKQGFLVDFFFGNALLKIPISNDFFKIFEVIVKKNILSINSVTHTPRSENNDPTVKIIQLFRKFLNFLKITLKNFTFVKLCPIPYIKSGVSAIV